MCGGLRHALERRQVQALPLQQRELHPRLVALQLVEQHATDDAGECLRCRAACAGDRSWRTGARESASRDSYRAGKPLHAARSRHSEHRRRLGAQMTSVCVRAAVTTLVACSLASLGCGSGSPTAPGSGVRSFEVACPTTLWVGERGPCLAMAVDSNGQSRLVTSAAQWTSLVPEIASVDAAGVVYGMSHGQAEIAASYEGQRGVGRVSVAAQDGVRLTSATEQGDFTPQATVTMTLSGHYSLASTDTARLTLEISDQAKVVAQSVTTVAKGGDSFSLSTTFRVPQESTNLCRRARLESASLTILVPAASEPGAWCVPIRR